MSELTVKNLASRRQLVEIIFSPEEIAAIGSDRLRYNGASVRRSGEEFVARFILQLGDAAQTQRLIDLLLIFGKDGDFAAGKKKYGKCESEPERIMIEQQQRIVGATEQWREPMAQAVAFCLRQKFSRVETLRHIREHVGEIGESEVRRQIEEQLRSRYHSLLFCQTFMSRLGWKSPLAANENHDSATAVA